MRDTQPTEGARRGSTAQQKADRLRVKAERLTRQADAWVSGAEREPSVMRKLRELPREYAVLHDVIIPGTNARCDHVVLGAGGIYVVDAKKYSGRLVYSGKMLWHGRFPITEKLENVLWEADCLADALGKAVTPVLCFVDQVLPQPVTTLGSVIVCRVSSLMTVVRSSHTTIARTDIDRIVAALTATDAASVDDAVPDNSDPLLDTDPRPATTFSLAGADPTRRPRRDRQPRRAMHIAKIAAACVLGLALAAGTVVLFSSWLDHHTSKSTAEAPATTSALPPSTAAPRPTVTDPVAPTMVLKFNAVCPDTKGGWVMIPVWPGTLENLAYYEYAVQSPTDGSWVPFGNMTSPDPGALSLAGMAPGQERIIRVTPAFQTGLAGEPMFALIAAPTDPC